MSVSAGAHTGPKKKFSTRSKQTTQLDCSMRCSIESGAVAEGRTIVLAVEPFPIASSQGKALAELVRRLGDFELGCEGSTLLVRQGDRYWCINPRGHVTKLDLSC